MLSVGCDFLSSQELVVGGVVVEQHAVAVAVNVDVGAAAARVLEAVGPCVRHDVDHRGGVGAGVMGAVHVEGVGGLFPHGGEPFVVEGSYLVDHSQTFVGLRAPWVVVAVHYPLEMSAHAVACAFCQQHLGLQNVGELLLAVCLFLFQIFSLAVQSYGAPCAVFTVEQLYGLFQLLVVVLGRAAVGAAPVLYHVPVGALAAVAGGYGSHRACRGVHLTYYVAALLCKVGRQHTLVLQSPEHDARTVAALLYPLAQQALELAAELR